jgi:Mitochondrial biogenesis AIM24
MIRATYCARTFSDLTSSGGSSLSKTSSDGVVGEPIDFDVASKIEGNESQIVTVALEPGQVLRAESGAMMYMTDGVEMNTTTG